MTDDIVRKILENQNSLHHYLEPMLAAQRAIERDAGVRALMESVNREQQSFRAAFGTVDDLRDAGLLRVTSALDDEFRRLREVASSLELRFQLPDVAVATKLLHEWEGVAAAAGIVNRFHARATEIEAAIQNMRVPWLDLENNLRSIGAFVELQGIGHALQTMPAFGADLSASLRIDLGDWRDEIVWPSAIFTDVTARTSFYAAQGLDPALTALPAPAFEQSITIAGIKDALRPLVRDYHVGREADTEEVQEAGFVRTNAAHDRLQRFESRLRKFIDDKMTAEFGENWVGHRVPDEMRAKWLEKRQKAKDKRQR